MQNSDSNLVGRNPSLDSSWSYVRDACGGIRRRVDPASSHEVPDIINPMGFSDAPRQETVPFANLVVSPSLRCSLVRPPTSASLLSLCELEMLRGGDRRLLLPPPLRDRVFLARLAPRAALCRAALLAALLFHSKLTQKFEYCEVRVFPRTLLFFQLLSEVPALRFFVARPSARSNVLAAMRHAPFSNPRYTGPRLNGFFGAPNRVSARRSAVLAPKSVKARWHGSAALCFRVHLD